MGYPGVFLAAALVALIWLLVAIGMQPPGQYSSRVLSLEGLSAEQSSVVARELAGLRGIIEAVVIADEEVAYLKIDRKKT
jgi:hypothetical protein